MPSPVRFSPISTEKPLRLSSSATSRASLIGSFSGLSASGYLELPMTNAKRSPAANEGAVGTSETSNGRRRRRKRIFIISAVQPKRRRSSLRRGDLNLRSQHYQTDDGWRQPLGDSTLSRQLTAMRGGSRG